MSSHETLLMCIHQEIKQSDLSISGLVHSVAQLCPTLCDPMNRNTPGLPVHHQRSEFTQTVHLVSVDVKWYLIMVLIYI